MSSSIYFLVHDGREQLPIIGRAAAVLFTDLCRLGWALTESERIPLHLWRSELFEADSGIFRWCVSLSTCARYDDGLRTSTERYRAPASESSMLPCSTIEERRNIAHFTGC
jgi:hypothetical protein